MKTPLPALALLLSLGSLPAAGAEDPDLVPIPVPRTTGSITVDGELSDPGWKGAAVVDTFWETFPADNVPAKVRTIAYLTYDAKAFYIGLKCDDPNPGRIRAPYVDRDQVLGTDDNVAIFLDTHNDRRSAMELRVNPRGIQADALWNEALQGNANQEDFSPDFFYDTAAKIGPEGWTAEVRIPFSTLRYGHADPQTWGILIWRNFPREFRYAIYSSKIPRGLNCLLCRMRALTGLSGLPAGGHVVVAPYATLKEHGQPRDRGDPRSEFSNPPARGDGGIDAKWIPNPNLAIDGTLNPDFSQVESDVAQLAVNARFALFFPEKRPFFLESSDLFQEPISAVYTRTITSPRWGLRATGKTGSSTYTVLVTEDRGGGSLILPGPESSEFAPQDFRSTVAIGRLRRDLGRSFAGLLVTDREISGGGHNRVVGPDFQWRASDPDLVTGQFLFSDTRNPDRPDLTPRFDGRRFSSRAYDLSWNHSTASLAWLFEHKDFGEGFRADDGFVPQVGYREDHANVNYTFYRPRGPLNQVRPYVDIEYEAESGGALLSRRVNPGIDVFGRFNLFAELSYYFDERIRTRGTVVARNYTSFLFSIDPSRRISRVQVSGHLGQDIDFANARPGHGGEITAQVTVKPTDHLALVFDGDRQWLDVRTGDRSGRLFTAEVSRLKATYTFNARSFLRLIGQYVSVVSDPSLYTFPVPRKTGNFDGSALFSYKLNWQTVAFLGYGDSRALFPEVASSPAPRESRYRLLRTDRQFFLKLSYAIQG